MHEVANEAFTIKAGEYGLTEAQQEYFKCLNDVLKLLDATPQQMEHAFQSALAVQIFNNSARIGSKWTYSYLERQSKKYRGISDDVYELFRSAEALDPIATHPVLIYSEDQGSEQLRKSVTPVEFPLGEKLEPVFVGYSKKKDWTKPRNVNSAVGIIYERITTLIESVLPCDIKMNVEHDSERSRDDNYWVPSAVLPHDIKRHINSEETTGENVLQQYANGERSFEKLNSIFSCVHEGDGFFYCSPHPSDYFTASVHNGIEEIVRRKELNGDEVLPETREQLTDILIKLDKSWERIKRELDDYEYEIDDTQGEPSAPVPPSVLNIPVNPESGNNPPPNEPPTPPDGNDNPEPSQPPIALSEAIEQAESFARQHLPEHCYLSSYLKSDPDHTIVIQLHDEHGHIQELNITTFEQLRPRALNIKHEIQNHLLAIPPIDAYKSPGRPGRLNMQMGEFIPIGDFTSSLSARRGDYIISLKWPEIEGGRQQEEMTFSLGVIADEHHNNYEEALRRKNIVDDMINEEMRRYTADNPRDWQHYLPLTKGDLQDTLREQVYADHEHWQFPNVSEFVDLEFPGRIKIRAQGIDGSEDNWLRNSKARVAS